MFPEVQAKAQAVLDSVVGNDRMPTFKDKDHLPFITAIMYETLRWHTVSAQGNYSPLIIRPRLLTISSSRDASRA